MHCNFCNIIKKEANALVVWENREFLLFLDIKPINPGHLLLIPKKHIGDVFLLEERTYVRLFKKVKQIAAIVKKNMKAPRVGIAIEGFGVPHAHVHIVPVYKGNELNPLKAKCISEKKMTNINNLFVGSFNGMG
ncbi:MAG: hypothetical protein A3I29_01965 [Candidatus Magasanikbacteria bacterium RIFCSPLOWO2_02_FULL_44_11]|uniref:HIT domain-containing protein n=1 Tax=Candidatus Magasanikbacteria bacterium RIFCSPLOWO2_02_FULL_44_11 TaxID=1798689 RepID=A0A1F6N9X3_9BACT|nr:MAG: hypothetical protein A3I29_01965 [Candidatus Magasanikbacteria bacterium RIFCSPLOWO2_02_FULL_44_11]